LSAVDDVRVEMEAAAAASSLRCDPQRSLPFLPPGSVVFLEDPDDWSTVVGGTGVAPRPPIRQGGPATRAPKSLEGGTSVVFPGYFEGRPCGIKVYGPTAWLRPVQGMHPHHMEVTSDAHFGVNEATVFAHLLRTSPAPLAHVVRAIGVCMVSWRKDGERDVYPRRLALVLEWLGNCPSWPHLDCFMLDDSVKVSRLLTNTVRLFRVLDGVASALVELHENGVVHGDLKRSAFSLTQVRGPPPEIYGGAGEDDVVFVKVFDLTHARLVDARTSADALDGKKYVHHASQSNYPSPEPAPAASGAASGGRSRRVGPWVSDLPAATPWLDVYALGVMFQKIVGSAPDRATTTPEGVDLRGELTELFAAMKNGERPEDRMTAREVARKLRAMRLRRS
jgi:hypothetical protein